MTRQLIPLLLALSLAACGGSDSPSEDTGNAATDTETDTGEDGDQTEPEPEPEPEPELIPLSVRITKPTNGSIWTKTSAALVTQWTVTDDSQVSEYRVAVRNTASPDVDLGYTSERSRGQVGEYNHSNQWFAPIEPGNEYALKVWMHDARGAAIDDAGPVRFHVVDEAGCYGPAQQSHPGWAVSGFDDIDRLGGCATFGNVGFGQDDSISWTYTADNKNPLAPVGRDFYDYIEVTMMAEQATHLGYWYDNFGAGNNGGFWFVLPSVPVGTPVYLRDTAIDSSAGIYFPDAEQTDQQLRAQWASWRPDEPYNPQLPRQASSANVGMVRLVTESELPADAVIVDRLDWFYDR